jgi:hypothetical protein
MSKVFTFATKGQNEVMDSIVDLFDQVVTLKTSKNFSNDDNYKSLNKCLSESIIKYCCEESGKEYTGLDMVKNPMVVSKTSFKEAFETVIAQIITPVVPKLTSEKYATLYDVAQVGFGDNAKYEVDSNELFIVNEAAEGITRGAMQTLYKEEYTVKASKKTINVGIDWYHVAAGVMDWGTWAMKISKSFEAYINRAVVKALEGIVSDATQRNNKGIAGYYANGISDVNWLTLKRNVSAANGGAAVYALGTELALNDVLPAADTGFRYGENGSYVVNGHLPVYKDVPLLKIDNGLIPNTVNGTPSPIASDNYIYMIALGSYKPVHVVFEGNTVSVNEDPTMTKDNIFGLSVDMRIGVDVIAGSKFGVIFKG